jgi:hypothetical protein
VPLPQVQGPGSDAALSVTSSMVLFTIVTTTALLLDLLTHQTFNYLNNPRDANATCLLPRLPLRLPSNSAKPLYSQPPPLNLPTRKTSRTPHYSHLENHNPYIRPGSRENRARATRWGEMLISWRIGIISTISGNGEIWVEVTDNRLLKYASAVRVKVTTFLEVTVFPLLDHYQYPNRS